METWPSWYPGLTSVTRTNGMGGPPATVGNRFVLQQKLANFQVLTTYEVVAVEDYKQIVFSGRSQLHTTTDQLVFMPDRTDPSFTFVRYMSNVDANKGDWRAPALKPLLSSVVSKVPEQAMDKLRTLLGGSNTPLSSIRLPSKEETRSKTASGSSSRPKASAAARKPSSNLFQSLGGFFGNFSSAATVDAADGASLSDIEGDVLGDLDPKRYYRVLGLDPRDRAKLEAADIRAAFRKLAQTMHPDKAVGVNEAKRATIEMEFRAVQTAYEVLRDPDSKSAYDKGQLVEEKAASGSR